jgi:hypothetical protein
MLVTVLKVILCLSPFISTDNWDLGASGVKFYVTYVISPFAKKIHARSKQYIQLNLDLSISRSFSSIYHAPSLVLNKVPYK